MLLILVMFTSHSDSIFEQLNINVKENKWDGVDSNSGSTTAFERIKEKLYAFRQTVVRMTPIHTGLLGCCIMGGVLTYTLELLRL